MLRETIDFTSPNLDHLYYSMKFMHRPDIIDNIKRSQLFEGDAQIERFVNMVDKYKNMNIHSNGEEEQKGHLDIGWPPNHSTLDMIRGQRIIQLKTNFIPQCLVPLERMFDSKDVPGKPYIKPKLLEVRDNLNTT